MGFLKQLQIEEESQGYRYSQKRVCDECFDDYAIKEYVHLVAEHQECDYCGRQAKHPIAANLGDILRLIVDSIKTEWEDPDNEGMMYSSEEGGYIGQVLTTDELFDTIGWPTDNEQLHEDIVESIIQTQWCKRFYFTGTRQEALRHGWEKLSSQVKHVTRFVFLRVREKHEFSEGYVIDSADLLDELAKELRAIQLERVIAKGTLVYRCRIHDATREYKSAKDCGPPPEQKAIASRMSAVGIPIFYGAMDEQTAVEETCIPVKGRDRRVATIAPFEALRNLRLLDLTDIPQIPSIYDAHKRGLRDGIKFLKGFLKDITQPVSKDGSEHIEYCPTQVVAEYLRFVYRDHAGDRLDGILYPSTRVTQGVCVALFLKDVDCCDDLSDAKNRSLLLHSGDIRRKSVSDFM